MSTGRIRFVAELRPQRRGLLGFALPPSSATALGTRGQVAVTAEVAGVAYQTIAFPRGDGTHFIFAKAAVRRRANLSEGQSVEVSIERAPARRKAPLPKELGAELFFERVALRPGKPTVFAKIGEQVVLGLPGNPVSVAVAFHIFARPALLRMQGASEIGLRRVRAVMTQSVKGAPPRRSHQPGHLFIEDGRAFAEPLKWSGSSDLVAFMRADALIVVPEDRARLEEGELAEVISLRN